MKSKIIKKFRVQLKNMIHPIETNTKRYGLRHASVRGGEDLDGQVFIAHQGKILDYSCQKRA